MARTVGLLGAALGALITLGLATPSARAGDGLLWRSVSNGNWSGSQVALGNHGTQVFAQVGSYGSHTWMISAHDSDPPTPVWDEVRTGAATRVSLASAAASDVHVVVDQTTQGMTLVATLRKYSSASTTADWSWPFPFSFLGASASVAVSDDGERIVAVAYDFTTTKNRLAVFGRDSAVPLALEELPIFMPIQRFALSGDGTTLCAVSDTALVVYDVDSATLLHHHFLFSSPNLNALAISRDGATLVYGTIEEVQVFERGGADYQQTYSYPRPAGSWAKHVTLSADGSTMACGMWVDSGPTGLHLAAVDLASEVVLTSRDFSAENDNLFSALSISATGERLAVGFTGGDGTQGEEALVFDTALALQLEAFDLDGVANDLELSPDGTALAIAHSGSNANPSIGGAVAFFQVGDPGLSLRGVPRTGAELSFLQRVEGAGGLAQLMVAPGLEPTPTIFPEAGALYLRRPLITLLPPATPGAAPGTFETRYTITDPPGTTLFFQGVAFFPDEFTDNFIKVTVLP